MYEMLNLKAEKLSGKYVYLQPLSAVFKGVNHTYWRVFKLLFSVVWGTLKDKNTFWSRVFHQSWC